MFGSKSGQFDRYLDRATSQLLLEPDWDSILQICDSIRQNDVQSKYAVNQMRKKVNNDNPHVAMFALQVLESVVKNCGSSIHEEIASKDFMEFFKEQVKKRPDPVKGKICELIQVWSHAFRNEPSYKIVQDTFHLMKMEGYQFPTLKEADAMFMAEKAPEWKDGETCHRCRVQFSTFQRKHHCRNCGQVFCGKCSSKNSIIPRFGIEREVRVCDACFDTLNKTSTSGSKKEEDLPAEYLSSPLSQQSQMARKDQAPAKKSEQELQEEEELQLALALSMSEQAEKEKQKGKHSKKGQKRERMRPGYTGGSSNNSQPKESNSVYANSKLSGPTGLDTSDMDPELARYLNRNYWEQKNDEVKSNVGGGTQPSAPVANNAVETKEEANKENENYHQNGENGASDSDEAQFLNALTGSIEIFMNRMKSNSMRGRSIANDSSVQTLFMTLNTMHPQLMTYIQKQEENRAYYESLQDKLAQLKDAREALNDLREEHRERKRREQEELERQRQIAMAARLEKLRQKKQEYLEYQRQLAMQRMQEQEREMAMRLEQQKQMQQMRAMQYSSMQPAPGQMAQQMYPGGYPGSAEGSPHHQQYLPQGPPPAGYQSMPPQQQQYPGYGQYAPPQQAPMGMPPQQGYPAPAPGQEYAPYNMQGMVSSLPGGAGMPPPQQQQPPPPQTAAAPPPQQQAPAPGQYPPPPQQAMQQPPPPQGVAPPQQAVGAPPPPQGVAPPPQDAQQQQQQQQAPPPQQQSSVDQLISFD